MHFEVHDGGRPGRGRPPLILLHGAGGNRLFWPPAVRRLEGQRVYALDLPGHGRSPGPGADSIQAYATAVAEWAKAELGARGVLVGHSMGSAIALAAALDHPEAMAGLILIGSGARLRVNPALLDELGRPETVPQALDKVVGWSFGQAAPPRLVTLARKRMAEVDPHILLQDFLACDRFDPGDRLGEIRLPTLVLCGNGDRMTRPRDNQALAQAIPGAEFEAIDGAGHMAMLEQPGAVARAIARFVERRIAPTL